MALVATKGEIDFLSGAGIGNRQNSRYGLSECININFSKTKIIKSMENILKNKKNTLKKKVHIFGRGNSSEKILKIFRSKVLHKQKIQKSYKNLLEF